MSTLVLPAFDLLMPQTLKEAVGFLGQLGKDVAVLAGGTDLLVQMKAGLRPPYVLSLAEVPDLAYVAPLGSGGLKIGAMATMRHVVESQAVKERYVALWQAAAQNGTPQTRNAATVVGNILRASPAGDCSCAILAHGAKVALEGPAGRRHVDIDQFWLDYMVTARQPYEVAVEVELSAPKANTRSAFKAMNRNSQDLSKISGAVSLEMDGDTCRDCRIAMGAVAPMPIRLPQAEACLKGKKITETALEKMAETAQSEIRPIDDVRSTAEYRRAVTGVLLKRIIKAALTG